MQWAAPELTLPCTDAVATLETATFLAAAVRSPQCVDVGLRGSGLSPCSLR